MPVVEMAGHLLKVIEGVIVTRPKQKRLERAVLDQYMELSGLGGKVEDGPEPPDFVVRTNGRNIAVEVTGYHQPLVTRAGFTRREVEAAWAQIREYVVEFREDKRVLDGLSVRLGFHALAVPSTKDVPSFVEAVTQKIVAARDGIERAFRYLPIADTDPPVLKQYLRDIRLRVVDCYMEWDWNHDFAGIGTSDQEMMLAVGPKLLGYHPARGIDEHHLVISGWNGELSQVAAPMHEEELNSFIEFNQALEESQFDQVTMLDFRDFIWRRGIGWKPLGKHKKTA